MKTNWFKRTLCSILAFVMVLGYVPATAFAAAEDGLCEHHTQHTQECGYSPAVEAHDCGHEHTDDCYDTVTECVHTHDDCGFVEVVAGVSCGHICSEESGCIQRVMNCQHQHDSECGYAEEKTESSCTYACEECEKERAPQQNKRSEEQTLDISSILTWEDYLYTLLADGSVSICGFEGAPENEEETFLVEIPSEINGAKVTEIAEKAFAGNEEIEIALLPKTIDAIGNGAFEDCKNLKVVAFCGEDLSFGKSFAKYSEKLETILVLKDSDFAELANILEQDLGEAKAGSIQFRSFTNIAALEEAVQAEGANSGNGDVDRQLGNEISALNTAGNINALTTTYGKATMEARENENIVASGLCGENVQWKLDKDGLLTISGTGEMQDYDSHDAPWHDEQFEIKSVIVEKNVTNIGVAAFWDCGSITSVTISEGVNTIGEDAFRACSNLTSVAIPEGVTSIGNCAFGDCINLISVSIPESVTTIGDGVFYRCNSLTSVTIPEGITAIASETFYGCSSLTSLTIPKSVTSIGAYAFEGCSGLTSMAIPEGVAAIGVGAFRYCSGLTTVSIPKGVATLDNYTFDGCSSLVSATIPEGVATIGGAAFSNCSNLTSATIPSSVTSIGFAAFSGCTKLTDIHYSGTAENWEKIAIGDDNTALINAEIQFNATLDKTIASGKCGENVFWTLDSEGILTISGLGQMNNFATSYPEWGDRKSIIKQVKITEGVESIGARAFEDYYNIESVIIPASVSEIGWNAFYRCSRLTSATIAEGVTSIGSKAFGECRSLSNFSIPSSVNQIGSWAFYKCESITSIIVPDGVATIGEYTFDSCTSLTSVTIPASITAIDDAAFNCCNNLKRVNIADIGKWCQIKFYDTDSNPLLYAGNLYLNGNLLTEVDIPEGIPKISDHSFCYCDSLIKVTIPRSVTSIGEEAFSGCENLMSVTIPSGVTHIGKSAFSSCSSLTGISIPDSVSSIGDEAFYGCSSLETVSLSGRITEIGKELFSRCRNLSSVEIPDGVTSIGDRAFSYCSSLTSITIPASITSIGNAAFDSCNKLASIYISDIAKWCAISFGSGSHYTNTNPLRYGGDLYLNGQLLTEVIIPSGVTRIKDDAFGGCGSITRVVIPNGATHIGARAFSYCEKLESIVIPQSLTYVGDSAFTACTSLSGVYITDLSSWCNTTFYSTFSNPLSCAGNLYLNGVLMTEIDIPKGTSKISSYAFYSSNLTKVTIPDSVAQIGKEAFCACVELTSITIPGSVAKIESGAFEGCHNLTNATIKKGVATIGEYAFYNCIRLKNVTMSSSVTMIDHAAFYCCGSLSDVYYTGSEEQWGKINIWWSGNNDLTDATIHYNSAELISGDVRYFRQWDAEKQIAHWGIGEPDVEGLDLGSQVTAETDTSFLENVNELVGTYVLVETKRRDDGLIAADTLLSVKPVETRMGIVKEESTETKSITIDDTSYDLFDWTQAIVEVDDIVMYHLYEGKIVGTVTAQELSRSGTVTKWNADARQITIGSDQYSVSPFADATTLDTLGDTGEKKLSIAYFMDSGVVYKARPYATEKPPYNTPRDEYEEEFKHDPAESYLLDYRDKWDDAYEDFISVVGQALNEYAGRTEVKKRYAIEAEAARMKKHDNESSSKYISGDLERRYEDAAYKALATYFYEEVDKYVVPDLSSVDVSKPMAGAQIVNNIFKNIGGNSKEYVINGTKIEIIPAIIAMGTTFGKMVINDDRTVVICSTKKECEETINAYVDDLQDLTTSAIYKVVSSIYKDVLGKSIIDLTEDYLNDVAAKIERRCAVELSKELNLAGVGDLFKSLDTCYTYYEGARKALAATKTEDIQKEVNNIITLKFEDTSIKNGAVKTAMKQLNKATNKLNRAFNEYLRGTIVQKENGFFRQIFGCPVNVAVYNSAGEQIGYIGEDDLWYADNLIINRIGTSKEIIMLDDEIPSFVVTATDYGEMSCSFEECDDLSSPIGRLNFYSIPLTPGQEFTVTLSDNLEANAESIVLESNGEVIHANEYISVSESAPVSISCTCEGMDNATIYGAGPYVRGDVAVVCVEPQDGFKFIGWYDGGTLVSDSVAYEFIAREDKSLTARFRQDDSVRVDIISGDGGIAIGDGIYSKGRTVYVLALPLAGHAFSGWYLNGTLLSDDDEYSIDVQSDISLEAMFVNHDHQYLEPTFSWAVDNTCKASFACTACSTIHVVDCAITQTFIPATETEASKTIYTATAEFNGKTYTDTVTIANSSEVRIDVDGKGLNVSDEVWIDGAKYSVQSDDNGLYVALTDTNARTMVTYSYNNPNATDVHTKYPTGMRVWTLAQENGAYSATYVSELDNLLQYSGSSIRITGNKGIRMITSINQDTRNKLTGNGLAGFQLLEYGTLLAQTSKLGDDPLVLGGANVKANYAYKKGVADPVFKYADGLIQYTNVLVGFTEENCKEDIAMRPYIKLQDENGEVVTIYGGIVYRSIGYIAYQNRKAFPVGSAAYEYVWNIIHYVYGNQYDADYKK